MMYKKIVLIINISLLFSPYFYAMQQEENIPLISSEAQKIQTIKSLLINAIHALEAQQKKDTIIYGSSSSGQFLLLGFLAGIMYIFNAYACNGDIKNLSFVLFPAVISYFFWFPLGYSFFKRKHITNNVRQVFNNINNNIDNLIKNKEDEDNV